MRRLLAILWGVMALGAWLATNSWGAAYTSTQTGNWSDTATWGGSGPPGNGDSATVLHAVTFDAAATIGNGTTAITVSSGGSLTQAANLTLNGDLYVGGESGGIGTFTLGAGTTLALGTFSAKLNECYWLSNSTSGSWATITGSGAITNGSYNPSGLGPKKQIDIAYVSHQLTGVVNYQPKAMGTVTSKLSIQHSTFNGTGAIGFGGVGLMAPAAVVHVDYCDFRDIAGDIVFGDTGNDPGANVRTFHYNTLSQSVTPRYGNLLRGMTNTGSVFDNFFLYSASMGRNVTHSGVFVRQSLQTPPDTNGWTLFQAVGAQEQFVDSYVYSPSTQLNSHFLQTSSTTGTPAASIARNVFEFLGSEPNILNYQKNTNLEVKQNLVIGDTINSLVTIGGTSDGATGLLALDRNTLVGNQGGATGMVLQENAGSVTSAVVLTSNLIAKLGETIPWLALCNNPANVFNLSSDYNATPGANAGETYSNVDTLTGGSHDIYGLTATFVDPTRGLATWDAARGSGTGTDAAAVTYLLGRNGYSAATKTQSSTPTPTGAIADLVAWVRAGYAPTNRALKGAGYGGVDIGAVDVVVKRGGGPARWLPLGLWH